MIFSNPEAKSYNLLHKLWRKDNKMKNKFFKITLTIMLSILFSISIASAKSLQKIDVVLDWYINPNHLQLIIGKEQGIFEKYGLDVNIVVPADDISSLKLVELGKEPFGIYYGRDYIQRISDKKITNATRIATIIDKPIESLVVRADSNITKPADFKGKRIAGYDVGENVMIRYLLKTGKLTTKDINIVQLGSSLNQYLISNQVDIIQAARNVEYYELQNAGIKVNLINPEDFGFVSGEELIIVANKNYVNKNKEQAKNFVKALDEASAYIKKQAKTDEGKNKLWETYKKLYPEQDNENSKLSLFATLDLLASKPSVANVQSYDNLAKFLYDNQYITNKVVGLDKFIVDVTK